MSKVIVQSEDGSERDISEHVRTAYDCVVGSMDWGSGFLDTAERKTICELAEILGTSDLADRAEELRQIRQLERLEAEYIQRRDDYAQTKQARTTTHVRFIAECETCHETEYFAHNDYRRSWTENRRGHKGHTITWREEHRSTKTESTVQLWWILDCEMCGPAGRIAYMNKAQCERAVEGHKAATGHPNVQGSHETDPNKMRGWEWAS